jgi:hypothetical protein
VEAENGRDSEGGRLDDIVIRPEDSASQRQLLCGIITPNITENELPMSSITPPPLVRSP